MVFISKHRLAMLIPHNLTDGICSIEPNGIVIFIVYVYCSHKCDSFGMVDLLHDRDVGNHGISLKEWMLLQPSNSTLILSLDV